MAQNEKILTTLCSLSKAIIALDKGQLAKVNAIATVRMAKAGAADMNSVPKSRVIKSLGIPAIIAPIPTPRRRRYLKKGTNTRTKFVLSLTASRLKAEAQIREFKAKIEAERLSIQQSVINATDNLRSKEELRIQILELISQRRDDYRDRVKRYLEDKDPSVIIDDVIYPLSNWTSAKVRLATNRLYRGTSTASLMAATGEVYRMVGMKVRYRSPLLVVDEIEHVLSYGITRINIADDFFTSNKKRVRALCDEIMKRNIKFEWSAFARVDSVDKECLEMMLKAGCDTVSFGIESGNQGDADQRDAEADRKPLEGFGFRGLAGCRVLVIVE